MIDLQLAVDSVLNDLQSLAVHRYFGVYHRKYGGSQQVTIESKGIANHLSVVYTNVREYSLSLIYRGKRYDFDILDYYSLKLLLRTFQVLLTKMRTTDDTIYYS
jgi:hypothetical protein